MNVLCRHVGPTYSATVAAAATTASRWLFIATTDGAIFTDLCAKTTARLAGSPERKLHIPIADAFLWSSCREEKTKM